MILALFSLYPVLAATLGLLTTGMLCWTTTINTLLTTLCVSFYMMLPPGTLDHWFASLHDLIRMGFPDAYERFLRNIRYTFHYKEENPPPRALYLWHPHGAMSMAPMVHSVAHGHSRLACMSVFHRIPMVRDLYHYVRAIPSDYDTMKATLEKESVSVTPGGVREMMQTGPGVLRLVRNRTGVFRMALETGTPIVPVLTYGENELFPLIDTPWIRSLNQTLYRRWGVILPILSFKSFLNWLQLADAPLPAIRSYAGPPIEVPHIPRPTDADIQQLRERYASQLESWFAKTAPKGYRLEWSTP